MSGRIIRALPGLGKSWLASKHADRFVDTDAILKDLFSLDATHSTFDLIIESEPLKKKFRDAIVRELEKGKDVLTNINPVLFGMRRPDVVYTMSADDYITHLKAGDRANMIELFGEDELKRWAVSHEGDNIIKLRPGQYLSDAVQDEGWLS